MTHSKDYLEARRHFLHTSNMQQKLEKDIDNGKDFFVENGYILFSTESDNSWFCFSRDHYSCCLNSLKNWLESFGWEIRVIEQGPDKGKEGLFAIKN